MGLEFRVEVGRAAFLRKRYFNLLAGQPAAVGLKGFGFCLGQIQLQFNLILTQFTLKLGWLRLDLEFLCRDSIEKMDLVNPGLD